LRVDHIDGLYDPAQYLERLRELAGDETYVIVEKILEPEKACPVQWPVQGNTGYDFLAIVNNLFTNPKAKKPFTQFYYRVGGRLPHGAAADPRQQRRIFCTSTWPANWKTCTTFLPNRTWWMPPAGGLAGRRAEKNDWPIPGALPGVPVLWKCVALVPEEATAVQDILDAIRQTETGPGRSRYHAGRCLFKKPIQRRCGL
jgi:hypothetical protein